MNSAPRDASGGSRVLGYTFVLFFLKKVGFFVVVLFFFSIQNTIKAFEEFWFSHCL